MKRYKNYVIKKSPKKLKHDFPKISPAEREQIVFWSRRISTTLLIGNSAGVVSVATYLSSSSDSNIAEIIAYPVISQFMTGTVIGFFGYFVSLFWVALRIEIFNEWINKINKIDPKGRILKDQFGISKPEVIFFTIFLSILYLTIHIMSMYYFYKGSSTIITAIGQYTCSKLPNSDFCLKGGTLLYNKNNKIINFVNFSLSEDIPTELKFIETNNDLKILSRMTFPHTYMGYKSIHHEMIFRITSVTGDHRGSCNIGIGRWFATDRSPYIITEESKTFIDYISKLPSTYIVEPYALYMSMSKNNDKGYIRNNWIIIGESLYLTNNEIEKPSASGFLTSNQKSGIHLYSIDKDNAESETCLDIARTLGFYVS